MGSVVVKVRPDQLLTIKKSLLAHSKVSEKKITNQYESFRFIYAGGSIVGYTSGKIVANTDEAARLVREAILSLTPDDKSGVIIGSDEAGKGEWLGPLVVAAVALSSQQSLELQGLGVMDSKVVRPQRMSYLASEVRKHALVYKIVLITPKKFNELFSKFHKEGKNLNDILAWAHAKAIAEALSDLAPKHRRSLTIIVDEFARAKTEKRIDRVVDLSTVRLIQRPRAEDIIAVAAASILARSTRDEWIDKKSRSIGIDLWTTSISSLRSHPAFEELVKIEYIN